jgi:hypothetical protein
MYICSWHYVHIPAEVHLYKYYISFEMAALQRQTEQLLKKCCNF